MSTLPSVPVGYSEHQVKVAQRVLDDLDRMEVRLAAHFQAQRQAERNSFRGVLALVFPPEVPAALNVPPLTVEVLARNLSRSGFSFIHFAELRRPKFLVCFAKTATSPQWFHAEIVRSKLIHEGFWEYGAKLLGRVLEPDVAQLVPPPLRRPTSAASARVR